MKTTKNRKIIILSIFIVVILVGSIGGYIMYQNYKENDDAYQEIFSFYSNHINDDLDIYIAYPKGYADSSIEYQTIYLLDANYFFNETCSLIFYGQTLLQPEEGMVSIVERLVEQNILPSTILVGIGYTEEQRMQYTVNEAENFHQFFTDELIPEIETRCNVSTKAEDRTIFGYSGSAHFSTYALFYDAFTGNRTFDKFISISGLYDFSTPIDDFEDDVYDDMGSNIFTNQSFFMGIGQNDTKTFLTVPHATFKDRFISRNYSELRFKFKEFEGKGHYDVPELAFEEALTWLFS